MDLFAYAERGSQPQQPDLPAEVPDDVARLFEKLALEVRQRGWDHYSSDAILHRIRWHMQVERGLRDFKCNNNWTAGLARWFLRRHPEMDGFFELRERRRDAA